MKKVIVAGASGLIGNALVELLLENSSISQVIALVRSPLPYADRKLKQEIVDYEHFDDSRGLLSGDAIYCCLGTTRKKTPDKAKYRRIDHDYPVMLAKIAAENNIEQYHFISALGANKNSSVFYNRLKGETEEDIKKLKFKSLHIYRPSLLVGQRKEKRFFERLMIIAMKAINPVLLGKLKKYRSIKAETVAKAMINQTFKHTAGVNIYPSDIIKELA